MGDQTQNQSLTHFSAWVPVVVTAILMPLAGLTADGLGGRGRLAALGGLFCLLTLDLAVLLHFSLPGGLFALVFASLFGLTWFFHGGFLSAIPFSQRNRLTCRRAALLFGTAGLLLLARPYLSQDPSLLPIMFTFGSVISAGLLAWFFLDHHLDSPQRSQGLRATWAREFAAFLREYQGLQAHFSLFTFLFLLALAQGLLAIILLQDTSVAIPQVATPYAAAIYLLVVAWAAFTAGRFIRAFGLKRTLTISLLLGAVLLLAITIATSTLELSLTSLAAAFFAGLSIILAEALAIRFIPMRFRGQGYGYLFPVLLAGLGVAWLLHDHFAVAGGWIHATVYILALANLQLLNANHGAAPGKSHVTTLLSSDDPDFEWHPHDISGLAKHTTLSRFAQILANLVAEIFFGRIHIEGHHHLRGDRGLIFVANHPNTFLDPLVITTVAPGRLHYWAKSTLWRLPILGSILDRLGAMPVHRRKDFQGSLPTNQDLFGTAAAKLNRGAQVLIFPEGVSEPGLSLKPIKTGAARLGFTAMEESAWVGDIAIVPIGLDYGEPQLFRTNITIRIGEPIALKTFREEHQSSPRKAVQRITAAVSESLKNLLPHLDEPALETLVHQIHDLYGERVLQILDKEDHGAARKAIANAVNHYQKMDPDTVYLFKQRMEAYRREAERLATPDNHAPIPLGELLRTLAGLFSYASYGIFTNWLPYRLTGRLVDWFGTSPVWTATAKLGLGSIVFAGYYTLLGVVFYLLFGPLIAFLLLTSILLSAFVALGAIERFVFRYRQLKTLWDAFYTQDTNDDLEALRVNLIQDLERFRESYEFYRQKEQENPSW